ncbi:MAG: PAS domain-containing protein [Chitinivibrionales bacterium]|nr:PAS domain-containing protein [Chitinivibrionales bacterium]MBD3356177.1 PAS domain-containing protein [Chitinivibrionales bacterium]
MESNSANNKAMNQPLKDYLLQNYGPAVVAVDRNYQIVFTNGPVDRFLRFEVGVPSWRILDLTPERFRAQPHGALERVAGRGEPETIAVVMGEQDGSRAVSSTISAYPHDPGIILLIFREAPLESEKAESRTIRALAAEIANTRHELQERTQPMHTSHEKFSVTIDELRVTNEKLEISREEMQSLNEELNTANAEMSLRNKQISDATEDLQNFFSSTGIPALFLDESMAIRRFTPPAEKMMSLRETDIGRPVTDLAHKRFGPGLVSEVRHMRKTRTKATRELQLEGRQFVREIRPFRSAAGKTSGAVVVYLDVSDLKEAQERISRSEELYRSLIGTLPGGAVFLLDHDLRYIIAERQALNAAGFTPEHFRGKTIWETLQPTVAQSHELWFRKALAGESFKHEHKHHGRFFLSEGVPMRNKEGTVESILVVSYDITALKETETALKESEERFRTLADNMSQFAWIADTNGRIFRYSKRWYEYTGTTFKEMEGWGWKTVHHPDHVERMVKRIRHSWDTGEPWEDMFPLRGKNGAYRWFLSRALPIRDECGKIVRWFGTNTDITAILKTEEDLRKSTEELLRTNRGLEAFSYSVSHDLREPLHTLKEFSDILLEDYRDTLDEEGQECLDRINSGAKKWILS